MNTVSITPAIPSKAQLRSIALALVIIALMLSLLLEALDQTIVGTAMPRIIAELHGLDRYTWVVTAYVLASMTMVPIVGKLSDQFGRKWFLLGGASLFLLPVVCWLGKLRPVSSVYSEQFDLKLSSFDLVKTRRDPESTNYRYSGMRKD